MASKRALRRLRLPTFSSLQLHTHRKLRDRNRSEPRNMNFSPSDIPPPLAVYTDQLRTHTRFVNQGQG